MSSKNPKLMISQYYDSLIREIDIFTEERLLELTNDQIIELSNNKIYPKFFENNRNDFNLSELNLDSDEENFCLYGRDHLSPNAHRIVHGFDISSNLMCTKNNELPIHTKDYYNQARDEILDELSKLQDEAFSRYDKIKGDLKRDVSLSEQEQLEMVRTQLFANKFAFIVDLEIAAANNQILKHFHLVVVDFYLSENARELLR